MVVTQRVAMRRAATRKVAHQVAERMVATMQVVTQLVGGRAGLSRKAEPAGRKVVGVGAGKQWVVVVAAGRAAERRVVVVPKGTVVVVVVVKPQVVLAVGLEVSNRCKCCRLWRPNSRVRKQEAPSFSVVFVLLCCTTNYFVLLYHASCLHSDAFLHGVRDNVGRSFNIILFIFCLLLFVYSTGDT